MPGLHRLTCLAVTLTVDVTTSVPPEDVSISGNVTWSVVVIQHCMPFRSSMNNFCERSTRTHIPPPSSLKQNFVLHHGWTNTCVCYEWVFYAVKTQLCRFLTF
jgi:hypothetical protein